MAKALQSLTAFDTANMLRTALESKFMDIRFIIKRVRGGRQGTDLIVRYENGPALSEVDSLAKAFGQYFKGDILILRSERHPRTYVIAPA